MLGLFLISLPFIAIIGFFIKDLGWKAAVFIVVAVALAILTIHWGVYLFRHN